MQYKGGIKTSQKPPFPPSVATYIHIKIDIYMMLNSDNGGGNKLEKKKKERYFRLTVNLFLMKHLNQMNVIFQKKNYKC